MKLSTLPVFKPEPLLFDYDEHRHDEFVHCFTELAWPLINLGIREDEMPDEIFEAYVFIVFMYGAYGEFSESRSLFCRNWRWMPAAARMARKIGAISLSEQLSEAWEEVQGFPHEILDCFDRGTLEWSRPAPTPDEDAPAGYHGYTYVSASMGERIYYLLNQKWVGSEGEDHIDLLPIDPKVYLPGGPDCERLKSAAATYLSGKPLPFEVFHDRANFNARIESILDRCDDYEVRKADCSGKNPFNDVWQKLRDASDQIKPRETTRSNIKSLPSDGFLLSEVRTNCGLVLVAYYRDMVQIVDPVTHSELAVSHLPNNFAMRSQAKERITYAEAWPWKLENGFHPIRC